MTAADFRRIALSLDGAEERAHMGHPDFRVRGKIFATLGSPDRTFAMVAHSPLRQEDFVREHPRAFTPVPGAWGEKGATRVKLRYAKAGAVREALTLAWRKRAAR